MPRLEFSAVIAAPRDRVWEFYNDVLTLPRITPPSTKVRLLSPPEPMRAGVKFTLLVQQPPVFIPLKWETVITSYQPPESFTDVQGAFGPFAAWHHEHRFEEMPNQQTRLIDRIDYTPPLGFLGVIADKLFIRRQLTAMFAYRYQKTREALETL